MSGKSRSMVSPKKNFRDNELLTIVRRRYTRNNDGTPKGALKHMDPTWFRKWWDLMSEAQRDAFRECHRIGTLDLVLTAPEEELESLDDEA
jgi:hypothetical protein